MSRIAIPSVKEQMDRADRIKATVQRLSKGKDSVHFKRSDGTSGGGRICDHCGHMWVYHIAPGCLCPNYPNHV
jgi:hypothetical protein